MGKSEKVVIDTNIFISAFGWGGKPLNIIKLLEAGEIRNCISEETIAEFIITGDKGLLSVKRYKNIKIITPEDFLITRK